MEIVVLWRRQPEHEDTSPAPASGSADGASKDDDLSPLQDGRLLA
jgi:hypothetical protein